MWTKGNLCFHLVCCCSLHAAPSVIIMSENASRYLWPCRESLSQVSLERKAVWRERLCYSSRQTLCLTLCRIDKDTALKFPVWSLWLLLHMCLYLSEYLDSPHLTCSVSAVALALIVLSWNWTSNLHVSTEDLPGFKYQHWPLKKSQRQGCRDTMLGKNPINLEVTKCFFSLRGPKENLSSIVLLHTKCCCPATKSEQLF